MLVLERAEALTLRAELAELPLGVLFPLPQLASLPQKRVRFTLSGNF